MKMAPLLRTFRSDPAAPRTLLVHTGQHYDVAMNDRLFADLKLRAPDVNLDVGSGTHAQQTAEIMQRFEPVVDAAQPSCVVVVGDVNSTLACSLVAVKKAIPSCMLKRDCAVSIALMPEEVNRLLTDQICDVLYTTERSATENLRREGISHGTGPFRGQCHDRLAGGESSTMPSRPVWCSRTTDVDTALLAAERGFGLVTLHRPSNVDEHDSLTEALAILREISQRLPLIWPLHPRTRASIDRFGLWQAVDARRTFVLPPQGYLETLGLIKDATLVITDSGGIQEETTALGVPCLTMRENTERPITVEQGTNVVVGRDRTLIIAARQRDPRWRWQAGTSS